MRIFATLCCFWTFNGVHWWACFELGIFNSWAFTLYSVCIFGFTVICIGVMLISGARSNKVKRRFEFLKEVIEEERTKKHEKQEKLKQEKEYEEKMKASKSLA